MKIGDRRTAAKAIAAIGALLLGGCADQSATPPPRPIPSLTLVSGVTTSRSDGQRGFNADIFYHKGFVYIGTWGSSSSCLGSSVKIVDVRSVQAPTQVGSIAEYLFTSSEDVVVRTVATSSFSGDLLAIGLQRCGLGGGFAAVEFWDVTTPTAARRLSTYHIEPTIGHVTRGVHNIPQSPDPSGGEHDHVSARGVHELDLEARGDRVYAYLAIPGGEALGFQAGMVVVDVTNPVSPVMASRFGLPRDLGESVGPDDYVHSVRVDPGARLAYLSYWDKGVVVLDVNDPSRPRYLGRTPFPAGAEGNAHSIAIAGGGRYLLQCDEDFVPAARAGIEQGWGYVRVYDNASPATLQQIGEFRTPNSRTSTAPGWWTVHNVEVAGNNVYASWYSDGVRKIDLTTPSSPREVATFVPPAQVDPQGVFATAPWIWGVALSDTHVFASDINAGLYILTR